MKKIWFKNLLIISIFAVIFLWIPFYTEAISKYRDFISPPNVFLYLILSICIFFWIMHISQNWLFKKIKPLNLTHSPISKRPVIVEYEPPKWINSAEAGLLFNCRVDPVDLTSLFYQWVNDKLISINCTRDESDPKKIKNVTLVKLKNISETYPYYEKDLFNNIFKWDQNIKIIDKNTDLSRAVTLEWLEDFWLCKHWLHRGGLSLWGILLSIFFIALIVLCFYFFKWLWILPLILFVPLFCGIIFKQNDKIRLTKTWKEITAHVLWYAKFIEKCDKNVLENLLKEDPLFVDKTLPYAVAFGLETQFIEKVTPLLKDIEQSWLFQKNYPTFPVVDTTSLIRMSLSKIRNNWKILEHWVRYLYTKTKHGKSWWNKHNESQGSQNRRSRDFGKVTYDKSLGFKIGSILLKWWKLFKKWWGWGWGWWKSW